MDIDQPPEPSSLASVPPQIVVGSNDPPVWVWIIGIIAFAFFIHVALGLTLGICLILAGLIAAAARFFKFFRKPRGVDLTKPVGFYVLRVLIDTGITIGIFLLVNYIQNQATTDAESHQSFTFLRILFSIGLIGVTFALYRFYQLYLRLDAGKVAPLTNFGRPQEPQSSQTNSTDAENIESRLGSLIRMKEQGIITEEEYTAKRVELINRI